MPIRIPRSADPKPGEITPKAVYERMRGQARERRRAQRRALLGAGAGAALVPGLLPSFLPDARAADRAARPDDPAAAGLEARPSKLSTMERPTSYEDVTGYNNFYEFGTDKSDPARYAKSLRVQPWTVSVEGEVARPRRFDVDELRALAPLEERIYRLRCVEGWSMVIPWIGYSFAELMKRVEPTGNAKFVEFVTLADPKQMPGLRSSVLAWPYIEGLRIDEAAHPLTLLTFGVYGEVLPRQNGAPLRIVVPWKYGFKSAKSLVTIRFVERQPVNSWQRAAPHEYGFYANVNPDVDHPRWSQATERKIGEGGLFARRHPTKPFNGYGDLVASLYTGMDLRKEY